MTISRYDNSELDAIEARCDPADIPGLVAALKQANAALSHPKRIEAARRAFLRYLGQIDMFGSPDRLIQDWGHQLVADWTDFAMKCDYVSKSVGTYSLTKRGESELSDDLRHLTADDL